VAYFRVTGTWSSCTEVIYYSLIRLCVIDNSHLHFEHVANMRELVKLQ